MFNVYWKLITNASFDIKSNGNSIPLYSQLLLFPNVLILSMVIGRWPNIEWWENSIWSEAFSLNTITNMMIKQSISIFHLFLLFIFRAMEMLQHCIKLLQWKLEMVFICYYYCLISTGINLITLLLLYVHCEPIYSTENVKSTL